MQFSNQLANLDFRKNHQFHFFSHNAKKICPFCQPFFWLYICCPILPLITIDPYIPFQGAPSTKRKSIKSVQWCSKWSISDETDDGVQTVRIDHRPVKVRHRHHDIVSRLEDPDLLCCCFHHPMRLQLKLLLCILHTPYSSSTRFMLARPARDFPPKRASVKSSNFQLL